MAHALSITDGTTTFSLTSTNAMLTQYVPQEPQAGEAFVSETVELLFYAADAATMQTAIQTLQRLLDNMRRKQAWGVGPVVYFQFQPDGDSVTWRAELTDARLEYSEDSLKVFPQAKMPASLVIQRAAIWEGALTQIPLANGNGTANTSGLTIYNHDDGGSGHDCYVQIAAADVTGSLPTPVKVELTNSAGSSVNYKLIFMACNAFSDPANFPHILEAETAVVAGATTGSNADCSNGGYTSDTVNTTNVEKYALSQALLQAARGYDFHLLCRYRSVLATIYPKPQVWDGAGAYPLWVGDESQVGSLSDAIIDLGVMPLPPGGYGTAYAAQQLQIALRSETSAAIQTDCFAFFPANTFRRLRLLSSVANGAKIVDDQTEGRAYTVASSVETPNVATQGMSLTVWPNTLQRVYFLWTLAGLTAPIDQTFTVKLWYRPRRYSL